MNGMIVIAPIRRTNHPGNGLYWVPREAVLTLACFSFAAWLVGGQPSISVMARPTGTFRRREGRLAGGGAWPASR